MSRILVLGGSYLQSDFVNTALMLGNQVHVLDMNPNCFLSKKDKIIFKAINIADVNAVESYFIEMEMDFVISPITEIGNKTASIISQRHDLNYNSVATVEATTDKRKMRSSLLRSNLIEPKVIILSENRPLKSYNFSYPSIVKPSISSASRGVTYVNNFKELKLAVDRAMNYCNSLSDIIVEEFLTGEQYSIETVSLNGEHFVIAIVKEVLSGSPYFMERMDIIDHSENKKLSDGVNSFVQRLLSELNIKYGPCHIEVKIDNELNIKLIEIASRSGLLRDRLIRTARGIDFNKLIIQSYIGDKLDDIHLPLTSAMLGIIAYKEDFKSYQRAKSDNLLFDSFMNGQSFVEKPTMLTDAVGYYFIQSDNTELFNNYKVKL